MKVVTRLGISIVRITIMIVIDNINDMIMDIRRFKEKLFIQKRSLFSIKATVSFDRYAITNPIVIGEKISKNSLKKFLIEPLIYPYINKKPRNTVVNIINDELIVFLFSEIHPFIYLNFLSIKSFILYYK